MNLYEGRIPTPSIVVNCHQALANIKKMQGIANATGCKLRPHIKTHKSPLFARMQLENGAVGITCAKLGEAEVMVDAGVDDIFIAYPLVDETRIQRAISLSRRCRRLILAVDSIEGANLISKAANLAGTNLEIRIEVDTGAARTGLALDKAVETARIISTLPALHLTGIYTFKSLILKRMPTTDPLAAGKEEGALLAQLRKSMADAGFDQLEISAGSTPTAASVAATGSVDEIRPGTYIFNDAMIVSEGISHPDEVAARVIATVVSCPSPELAIIDGGIKCFSTDPKLNSPPYYYPGYALVEGNDDLVLDRMSEEHGMLRSKKGNTGLVVGQRLSLVPIHICTTINLHNSMVLDWGDRLETIPVAARGMLI